MVKRRGNASWSDWQILCNGKVIRFWEMFDDEKVVAYEEDAEGNLVTEIAVHTGKVEVRNVAHPSA